MSLNNIELPSSVVVALYSSSLIDTGTDTTASPEQQTVPPVTIIATPAPTPAATPGEISWSSLGNNRQNILLLVDHPGVRHLPDEELGFITSILTACKLSLEDVAIINLNNYKETNCKDILAHFKSSKVILFGIEPAAFGLPVSFPHFQVQQLSKTTFLYAPQLEQLLTDKLLKSKLWVCLQRIFGLV